MENTRAHCVERRIEYRVLVGRPEGKRPTGRPRRIWRIILKWISKKWTEAWTRLIWLRIGKDGGLL
jgi:hypothetical protein